MSPRPLPVRCVRAGFTLVEVVITTGLVAMMAALLVSIGADAMRGVNRAKQSARTWEDLRALTTQLERDFASLAPPTPGSEEEPFTLQRDTQGLELRLRLNIPPDRVQTQEEAGPQEVEYTWDKETGLIYRIARGGATDPDREDDTPEEADGGNQGGQNVTGAEAPEYAGEVLARQVVACVVEEVAPPTSGETTSGTGTGGTAEVPPAALRVTLTTLAVALPLDAAKAPRRITEVIVPFPQAYVE